MICHMNYLDLVVVDLEDIDNASTHTKFQSRIFKRRDDIRLQNKVHEHIVGCKTYAHLPPHEELSLYHPKTIEKQIKQNDLYVDLVSP